jgi:carotenoid 1,2-hydratase
MTERGRKQLTRNEIMFQVGPSDLHWDDEEGLTINFEEVSVPFPPNDFLPKKLKGKIRLKPKFVTDQIFDIDDRGEHKWWPIAPSSDISVKFEEGGFPDWAGEGYLDSNWGTEPIEDCFDYWNWARGESADGTTTLIYDTYLQNGHRDILALSFDADGTVTHFDAPAKSSLGTGVWGVQRLGHHDKGHRPKLIEVYEDGPFYTRNQIETHLNGSKTRMMHESLSGKRIGKNWVKALLPWRMPRKTF